MELLTRLFGEPEQINGAHRCPTYLWRWILAKGQHWALYLHKFTGNDWSRDRHDHPKRFISVGLWGSYLEETTAGFKRYRAPWIRTFPAHHQHRLTTPWGTCWTLVLVLRTEREWGFWHDGIWVHWRDYVFGRQRHLADRSRDC